MKLVRAINPIGLLKPGETGFMLPDDADACAKAGDVEIIGVNAKIKPLQK